MGNGAERARQAIEFERELTENILPFWMTHVVDEVNGGLHGAVANDLSVVAGTPRSAVLCARVLWTFSAAASRFGGRQEYRAMAERVFDVLADVFWDSEYGGLYWDVDRSGCPVRDRKHHYAQAFGIYGLSEYHRTTGDLRSLDLAKELFALLESHARDPEHGGYTEGSTRDWRPLGDLRLSERDVDAPKSMNTMLHLLEAYTNLLRVWDDAHLRDRLSDLTRIVLTRIVDESSGHLRLFFEQDWTSIVDMHSYGHDIEASWLLCEAAVVSRDRTLQANAERAAVALANGVLRDGLDEDGSLFREATPDGVVDLFKDWWPQAEGIVGFYNAYQLSGDERFADAAFRCWDVVRERFVDRSNGDWFKRLAPDGSPDPASHKAGPWDCPYHHSRACLEMMERLDGSREVR
jgi:mannobiose 2-epimerase